MQLWNEVLLVFLAFGMSLSFWMTKRYFVAKHDNLIRFRTSEFMFPRNDQCRRMKDILLDSLRISSRTITLVYFVDVCNLQYYSITSYHIYNCKHMVLVESVLLLLFAHFQKYLYKTKTQNTRQKFYIYIYRFYWSQASVSYSVSQAKELGKLGLIMMNNCRLFNSFFILFYKYIHDFNDTTETVS